MQYQLFEFDELTSRQVWMIFKLRQEVFVLEQECLFPEIDDRDPSAMHLLGLETSESRAQKLLAYCRLFAPGDRYSEACISRVVIEASQRKSGLGLQLMNLAINTVYRLYGPAVIRIAAQQHLEGFYSRSGFLPTDEPYLEDDIWHQDMLLPAPA